MSKINCKLIELRKLFNEAGIYPQEEYGGSFAEGFMNDNKMKSYVKQLKQLLKVQSNDVEGIGADLPFWGERYFTEDKGVRVLIIGKESKNECAGSIVFHANYMKDYNENEYTSMINRSEKYRDYKHIKEFIEKLGLDWDFVYITDSKKTKDEFDKKLLMEEIKICKPKMRIILGEDGLRVLGSNVAVNEKRDESKEIIEGEEYYIANFPCARNNCINESKKNYERTITNNKCIKNFREEYESKREKL